MRPIFGVPDLSIDLLVGEPLTTRELFEVLLLIVVEVGEVHEVGPRSGRCDLPIKEKLFTNGMVGVENPFVPGPVLPSQHCWDASERAWHVVDQRLALRV